MNSTHGAFAQTGMDDLAAAWLTAGASTVSLWEQDRLLRQWPGEAQLGMADFVAPVRTSRHAYGEMRISGFSAPGWSSWRNALETANPTSCPRRRIAPRPHAAVHFSDQDAVLHGVDLSAHSRPAMEVGGDYFDTVAQPFGQLAFCVADVCGKGLSAAMMMPTLHGILRGSLLADGDAAPHRRLRLSNDDVHSLFENTTCFATALVGRYDVETRTVSYSNAGHAPVIYRSAAGKAFLLKADTPPLGIPQFANPVPRTIRLAEGDVLVVATDGLAEARNRNGEMYGYQRLLDLVDVAAHRNARTMVRLLLESVAAFTRDAIQSDDQTVMVLKGIA